MTAPGDAALSVAYGQVGVQEDPPYSNNVPYDDAWGFHAAWCATFVSWCYQQAGYPLPAIDGAPGFSYCPSGQIHGYTTGEAPVDPQPGDCLIFSWEAWHMSGGIAVCSYGAYAGAAAGDHTGFFAGWAGGGYCHTVEGNTSPTNWDNGGTVAARSDRYDGQICCYWRPASINDGSAPTPPQPGGGGGASAGTPAPGGWPGVYLSNYTEHPSVSTWQAQMVALGYALDVDGGYGPQSEAACIQFQSANGLEADGVVGPMTWDACFGGAPAAAPPAAPSGGGGGSAAPPWPGVYLSNYTEDPSAATWQQQMVNRGWHLGVDGQYGGESESVCRQFQAEKGLEADGVVGPVTWDATWTSPVT